MNQSTGRNKAPETYRLRLAQYQRRERMSIWVGAGLGGLIVLSSGFMAFQQPPRLLVALTVTLLVLAGGAVAFTRVGFEWRATVIQRMIDSNEVRADDALKAVDKPWPAGRDAVWQASLLLIVAASASLLLSVWIVV